MRILKRILEAANAFYDFLNHHPRLVGFAGFIVWLLGYALDNCYLVGFGSGTTLTAFLFFYRR